MNTVIEASGLGKRYGRRWALADCTLAVPAGRVTGLVGPNGAGKTTLLQLAAGLLTPTSGTITVLGERPGGTPAQLARVGFVAQDAPVYPGVSVAGHLRMGAWLNPTWDGELAERRIGQLGLDLRQRAGSLSGGQRAQLALTLAAAKRPELLLLDEPVASLDPLARREFLQGLAVKLGVAGLASMSAAGLLSLMVTWWSSPIAAVDGGRLNSFHSSGVAPVGYAAFAFALGAAAGLLIRRTVPAMAVTLAIFAAVTFAFPGWVRPHLIPPVQATVTLSAASVNGFTFSPDGRTLYVQTAPPDIPGAWILSSQLTTPDGRPASAEPATGTCELHAPSGGSCEAYIESLHLRQTVTYQPTRQPAGPRARKVPVTSDDPKERPS